MKFVIEIMTAEGPHWYAGVKKVTKGDAQLAGPLWSPYWEDAKKLSQDDAKVVMTTVCNGMSGMNMRTEDSAAHEDARVFDKKEGSYLIRAKYLTKGLELRIFGKTPVYRVTAIDDKEITLNALTVSGKAVRGDKTYLTKNCEAWVKVLSEENKISDKFKNN
jgi:hypothetical protein